MATQAPEEGPEGSGSLQDSVPNQTTEYCGRLQEWMWQYYCGYASWQNWLAVFASPLPSYSTVQSEGHAQWPPGQYAPDVYSGYYNWFSGATSTSADRGPIMHGAHGAQVTAGNPAPAHAAVQQQNGDAQPAGQEYTIPSPLHRFCAEVLDFLILFCTKAAIVLTVMHMFGMKDMAKLAMHFIVEEIDEDTSVEELQKMMLVALVYRVLVCIYEIICIWGAGGATPGKFLLGLRVVTCDTAVLVRPSRVRVAPASNVSLSASTVRALSKNFSIAFFFPAFVTLLFFQHNRTVYDIVAGTIVVKRPDPR